MSNNYFEESSLYSLACVLAYRRILLIDGIYSQIDNLIPGLGSFLKEKLNDVDKLLDVSSKRPLYRYHRLLLAESIMEKENGKLVICPYFKFRDSYENSVLIKEYLTPSKDWVSNLKGYEVDPLMITLSEIVVRLSKETKIDTDIEKLFE
jgi:hypothetical protein